MMNKVLFDKMNRKGIFIKNEHKSFENNRIEVNIFFLEDNFGELFNITKHNKIDDSNETRLSRDWNEARKIFQEFKND